MYDNTRIYEDNEEIRLKIIINKNLSVAFFVGTPIVLILIALLAFIRDIEPEDRVIKYNTVPVTMLNFGMGDGTGMSKGNLTAEGIAHKGKTPASELHDAEIASKTRTSTANAETDVNVSSNIKTVGDIGSTDKKQESQGNAASNVGLSTGSEDGQGLGGRGFGHGRGEGFGDIEWGGGGNRYVLQKKLPKYPKGVTASGQVKIRFRVRQDGTISSIILLQKVDPALEKAAVDALRQWRFNPLDTNMDMEGIIPFTFRLK